MLNHGLAEIQAPAFTIAWGTGWLEHTPPRYFGCWSWSDTSGARTLLKQVMVNHHGRFMEDLQIEVVENL